MARSSIPNMQESSSFVSVTGDLLKVEETVKIRVWETQLNTSS